MTGCYLTSLPMEFNRGMAGFEPEYPSSYFIARDSVQPPESLLKKVYPALDYWLSAHAGTNPDEPEVEETLAADGFLGLLVRLRPVVLQVIWALDLPLSHIAKR